MEKYTVAKLKSICKERGIKKYSGKKKAELIKLIKEKNEEEQKRKRSSKSFYIPSRPWKNIMSFCNGMLVYKEINNKEEFLENYWRLYQDMMYQNIIHK